MKYLTQALLAFAIIVIPALTTHAQAVNPMDQANFSNLNFNSGGPGSPATINLFTSPDQLTLSGGWAGVAGIGAFYHSGNQAWMLDASASGSISFETPASSVSFYLATSNGMGSLTVFDTLDAEIVNLTGGFETSISGGSAVFMTFNAADLGTGLGISRIDLTAPAGAAQPTLSIDDIGFTPVPEPTTTALVIVAVTFLGVVTYRRKQKP